MFVSSKIGTLNALYKNITGLKQERTLLFLHDVKSVANMLYPKNKVSSPTDCWKISISAIIGAYVKKIKIWLNSNSRPLTFTKLRFLPLKKKNYKTAL